MIYVCYLVSWWPLSHGFWWVKHGARGWGKFQIASPNLITTSSSIPYFGNVGHSLPYAKIKDKMPCKAYMVLIFFQMIHTYGGFIHSIHNLFFPPPAFDVPNDNKWRTQLEWTHILGPNSTTRKTKSHESKQEGQWHIPKSRSHESEKGNDMIYSKIIFL